MTVDEKELKALLEDTKERLENVDCKNYTQTIEEAYAGLWNAMADYWNESQDSDGEYLFDEIVDEEIVKQSIKSIMEDDDLYRLYYFLGDVDLREDIFRIDAYGNLQNCEYDDLQYIKDECLDLINEKLTEYE